MSERISIPLATQRKVQSTKRCACCGVLEDQKGTHEIHHIDGDSSNNNIENLTYLCSSKYKNCHLEKGHNGNFKTINNNLLKEITMKDEDKKLDDVAKLIHFGNRRHQLYNPTTKRSVIRGKNSAPVVFEKPIVINGVSYNNTKIVIDYFRTTINGDRDRYGFLMDKLESLNKEHPIKDGNGDEIVDFYSPLNVTGLSEKKYYEVMQSLTADDIANHNVNHTPNNIPVNITSSLLEAVTQNPSLSMGAKLIFDQYAV